MCAKGFLCVPSPCVPREWDHILFGRIFCLRIKTNELIDQPHICVARFLPRLRDGRSRTVCLTREIDHCRVLRADRGDRLGLTAETVTVVLTKGSRW